MGRATTVAQRRVMGAGQANVTCCPSALATTRSRAETVELDARTWQNDHTRVVFTELSVKLLLPLALGVWTSTGE